MDFNQIRWESRRGRSIGDGHGKPAPTRLPAGLGDPHSFFKVHYRHPVRGTGNRDGASPKSPARMKAYFGTFPQMGGQQPYPLL
jgi:hypothetical protein